jgi:hypothetical protein
VPRDTASLKHRTGLFFILSCGKENKHRARNSAILRNNPKEEEEKKDDKWSDLQSVSRYWLPAVNAVQAGLTSHTNSNIARSDSRRSLPFNHELVRSTLYFAYEGFTGKTRGCV